MPISIPPNASHAPPPSTYQLSFSSPTSATVLSSPSPPSPLAPFPSSYSTQPAATESI